VNSWEKQKMIWLLKLNKPVQVSLNPGQEKASYQTAEFAQAFFSEENLREAKSFDQKENAKRFRI
jgi:hypothetical protein